MKRIFVFLMVSLVVISALFASSSSIEAQFSPFSFQKIKTNVPADFNSKYGWGLKVGYRYNFTKLYYAGADVSYLDYKYTDQSNHYHVCSIVAKFGIIANISNSFKVDVNLGSGMDIRSWGSTTKTYPTFGLYAGGIYYVSEKVGITAGADLRFTWQKNNDKTFNSFDLNIVSNLGARINL